MKTLLILMFLGNAPFYGTVTKVIDGDTFEACAGKQTYKIRVAHIDCPEIRQRFGDSAFAYAKQVLLGKLVIVRDWRKDKYGRFVGSVYLHDGTAFHLLMLSKGLAWWYRAYSSDIISQTFEASAKARRAGLWRDSTAVPPWAWRTLH